jgi:hypothetical protein
MALSCLTPPLFGYNSPPNRYETKELDEKRSVINAFAVWEQGSSPFSRTK